MQRIAETDLVIVGGGPAGAAAAIAARSYALRVVVLERDAAPRIRPGEAAHPGIEPLLKRLGVMDAVQTADFLRYEGHWVAWGREPLRFVPFGQDERGPWKGFQLWRPDFDAILLDGAGRAGALIVRPCGELHPIVRGNRIAGVKTKAGTWRCAFVIDATGRQRWLARAFNLQTERHGPPRVAWFGYAQGHRPALDPSPMIASDASGWTWMARIRPSLYQWSACRCTDRGLLTTGVRSNSLVCSRCSGDAASTSAGLLQIQRLGRVIFSLAMRHRSLTHCRHMVS